MEGGGFARELRALWAKRFAEAAALAAVEIGGKPIELDVDVVSDDGCELDDRSPL